MRPPPVPAFNIVRLLIYGLSILHLGPGIAFALLSFGCDGQAPALGAVCGRSALGAFAALTVATWLVLAMGLAAVHLVDKARREHGHRAWRAISLTALVAFGTLVGVAAEVLTGTQLFYLAIPASLALGWLFLANPLACSQDASASESSSQHRKPV